MSERDAAECSAEGNADEEMSEVAWDEVAMRCPFGPAFFMRQLSAFARDRCPDPEEHLPTVELHLADGEVLDICHMIGLAPRWIALAVFDHEDAKHEPPPMRTELVPYHMVTRIAIRSAHREACHVGFEARGRPQVWKTADTGRSAEEALQAAAHTVTRDAKSRHCMKNAE